MAQIQIHLFHSISSNLIFYILPRFRVYYVSLMRYNVTIARQRSQNDLKRIESAKNQKVKDWKNFIRKRADKNQYFLNRRRASR